MKDDTILLQPAGRVTRPVAYRLLTNDITLPDPLIYF
jgi:hypothetical protein